MNKEEKPWENPKKFKVLLVTPTGNFLCAGDTGEELYKDIYDKMVKNEIEKIEFGFGWIGTMPVLQGWSNMHIRNAIEEHWDSIQEAGKNIR